MRTLVILGCSKSKFEGMMKAKELYMKSNLFKLSRMFCETHNFDYIIISAKYGVVTPDTIIENYDLSFRNNKNLILKMKMRIGDKLASMIKDYDRIIVMTGEDYIKTFKHLIMLHNDKFKFPFKGMTIGKRLQWLKQRI